MSLFYYFFILVSRSTRVPVVYVIVSLLFTLGFIAIITWAVSYVLLLVLSGSDLFCFDFLLMSVNSPEPSDPSSSGGGNNDSGGGPSGDDNNSGRNSPSSSSNDSSSNNSDDDLEENDVPDRHSAMSMCEHHSCMLGSDLASHSDRGGFVCDSNPIVVGEGENRTLVHHSAFTPSGDIPLVCTNCYALICYDCANNFDYDSQAQVSDSPLPGNSSSSDSDSDW